MVQKPLALGQDLCSHRFSAFPQCSEEEKADEAKEAEGGGGGEGENMNPSVLWVVAQETLFYMLLVLFSFPVS